MDHARALAGDSLATRVLHALKPASWAKLLVPAVLGQALGAHASGRFDARGLVLGALFVVADLIFVVTINDVGDHRVDAIKRRMFPHQCSPKTIPDGILSRRFLIVLGAGAGIFALAVGLVAERALGRSGALAGAAGCLLLFVAYTLPPFRLNYRGGGELLEMAGVGLALPLFEAYLQGGVSWPPGAVVLPGFAALAFGSAVASGLSDEVSDREGGKHTVVTWLGSARARRVVEGSMVLGLVLWCVVPLRIEALMPVAYGAIAAIPVLRASGSATTGAFAEQATYKRHLHRLIAGGALLWAVILVAEVAAT